MSLARTDDSVHRERAIKASDRLLASLRRHHGEGESTAVVPVPEPVASSRPDAAPVQPETFNEWTERQKKTWFGVDFEIGRLTIRDIQLAVCRSYKISVLDLISSRRQAYVVRPRQVGYFLSKKLTGKSLPEIGRRFGGRDHTSVLSGIRKIEKLRATDQELNAALISLAASLGGALE